MDIKKWIGIGIIIVVFGITFISIQRDNASTAVSPSVPAPQPGQKKVVLKNLGMA